MNQQQERSSSKQREARCQAADATFDFLLYKWERCCGNTSNFKRVIIIATKEIETLKAVAIKTRDLFDICLLKLSIIYAGLVGTREQS